MVNTFPYAVHVTPPRPCYFQALSWTGCGSCACRWVPGVAEEAVRSDCPLSVLPACKMDRVDEKCLFFHVSSFGCQYRFLVLNPERTRKKTEPLCRRKNLTLFCVMSLHEKSAQEQQQQKKSNQVIALYSKPPLPSQKALCFG